MKFTTLLAFLLTLHVELPAQEFRITELTRDNQGRPEVRFTAATNCYYILYRGDQPSHVTTAATLGLGLKGGKLSDPTSTLGSFQFYRLRQVPLDQPLDLDADGIDDVYELSHPDFLNPLNPADAHESFATSLTKIDEYLLQRDPNRVPQVFVTNATISCDDTRYDGRHIVVDGVTLTLDCAHTFKSLTVTNGGVVTHSAGVSNGLQLTITETVVLSANSLISLNAKGYAPGHGPGAGIAGSYAGGGGHGGRGGNGANGGMGGGTYGSVSEPTDFGSGSGGGNAWGGGALRLRVGGNLHVDGTVSADGQTTGGGGSGGSLWLQAASLSGSGLISANGGNANSRSGGGGGGRIAIYSGTNAFVGQVQALGGSGLELGGAGTMYFKAGAAQIGTLVVANRWHENRGSQPTELAGAWTFAEVIIETNGWLSHPITNALDLIASNVTVKAGGFLSLNAKGYAPGHGPGAGIAGSYAGGGGHGGRGGNGANGGMGGGTYGSVSEPTDFGSGSGGGNAWGGGALRLRVGGNLHVDGTVSADGQTTGGGGSGGSLWLQAASLSGSGLISANGGNANSRSGGGGGGRIAIYSETNAFVGQVQALGGSGLELGGAGTMYFKAGAAQIGTLVVANRWHENRGSQPTELAGAWTFAEVIIETNGWLSHPITNALDLIASNVTVKAGGFLSLNAKGYAPGHGPGAGIAGSYAGGGGHGGRGGNGANGGTGGGTYGSVSEPTDFGSGSGGGNAWGGGALRLRVGGNLHVDGTVSADGQTTGGGGSGGSLWLQAASLSGSGLISANGGNANSRSGGGGGGRIAIYSETNAFVGQVQALGGSGLELGGAGTMYFKAGAAQIGTLVVANRWHENRGSQPTELAGAWTFAEVIIETNGWLSHPITNALDLIASNVTVKAGGFLSLNAKGYAPGHGPGAGIAGSYAGGGGHGGRGGNGANGGTGGGTYGSVSEPTDFGSGSGGGNAWGGGALRLRVGGNLHVDGTISANGQTTGGPGFGGAGGAGGSLWLEATRLSGTGFISANGGNANTINSGGGGGGRIAIYTRCAPDLDFLTVEALGGTGHGTGEVGTIYFGIHESGLSGAVSFAGDITSIAPPPSVDFQQLTNRQTMFFFIERTNVTLEFPLVANITSPGRYDSQVALSNSLRQIPSGTPLSSYYAHFDTGLTNQSESGVSLTNTLTFDSEILGVILLTHQLINSDAAVGIPATIYPGTELNSLRGFEVGAGIGQDWVELHADRRTITISARVRDWADQLRIITSAYGQCAD